MLIHLCALIVPIELQAQDVWRSLAQLEDPRLQQLSQKLYGTVMSSKAPSTEKKYMYAFGRWKKWAESMQTIPVFPVEAVHLALYLQHLGDSTGSRAAVEEAVYALAWIHQAAGLPSPASDPFVQTVLGGLRRVLALPTVKKRPFTSEMLSDMVQACQPDPSLGDLRLMAACLLGFAAFLRYDELSKLRCEDLTFTPTFLQVTIRSSKTDQYRQGDTVLVARTGRPTCPVSMVEQYMAKGEIMGKSGLLFRPLTSDGKRLRSNGSLTYSRLRELLLSRLQELGYPADQFGVHSLRAGGATAAAGSGVPDRLFKRHGRWKSDTAKDGYVEDPMEGRLRVTQDLGI